MRCCWLCVTSPPRMVVPAGLPGRLAQSPCAVAGGVQLHTYDGGCCVLSLACCRVPLLASRPAAGLLPGCLARSPPATSCPRTMAAAVRCASSVSTRCHTPRDRLSPAAGGGAQLCTHVLGWHRGVGLQCVAVIVASGRVRGWLSCLLARRTLLARPYRESTSIDISKKETWS